MEFAKYVAGMHHACPPRLIALHRRAVICRAFPAYTLHELRDLPAAELLQALELLATADRVQSA